MSFKLFIYYCAVCGGWAAFFGWGLGRLLAPAEPFAKAVVQGLTLGLFVALALGVVDALWNQAGKGGGALLTKVGVAVLGGCLGGVSSAALCQSVAVNMPPVFFPLISILGWTITGLTIGGSVGLVDFVTGTSAKKGAGASFHKIRNGLLGGAIGGLVGGGLKLLLELCLEPLLGRDKVLVSPAAVGFVILGISIGLLIGLAQVFLMKAWLKVETGFRAGREFILSKPETVIGRSEGCDLGLVGDQKIDRTHARITLHGRHYLLSDAGSAEGTFVNEQRVTQPTRLHDGDAIRLGNCILRFGERQNRK